MMRRGFLLVALVITCLAQAADAPPRVSFIRAPHIWTEQDVATFAIRVEPNADNRLLRFMAVDEASEASVSDEWLDGNSPRTRWKTIRLPAGEWLVVAILYSSSKEIARAVQPVIVVGRG